MKKIQEVFKHKQSFVNAPQLLHRLLSPVKKYTPRRESQRVFGLIMFWFFSNILTTPTKTSTKDTKKHTKKTRNTLHKTTNDQIFSNNLISCPPAPSPTAQNTKPRHGKDTKLLKPEKRRARRSSC